MISVVSSNPGSFTQPLLPSSFLFFFFAFKSLLLGCCRLLCELLGVSVCARACASKLGIHLQEKRKAQAQQQAQQQQQEVHLQKDERVSFALEKDDRGRERKPFLFCFFSFLYEVGPSTAGEDSGRNSVSLCVCVCVMTTVGQFGRKSSFPFFSLLFFSLWGWLATTGFHSLSDTRY